LDIAESEMFRFRWAFNAVMLFWILNAMVSDPP